MQIGVMILTSFPCVDKEFLPGSRNGDYLRNLLTPGQLRYYFLDQSHKWYAKGQTHRINVSSCLDTVKDNIVAVKFHQKIILQKYLQKSLIEEQFFKHRNSHETAPFQVKRGSQ
eukprot:gb/GEZJ01007686.1/.p1 GENE.gb/GEZJ01007686.1/~~gb/GEZJ01007686.1/.p1  ORF type:complete len:114 (+),score=14.58 gb/GEZJ01007686.1/:441-782(+)